MAVPFHRRFSSAASSTDRPVIYVLTNKIILLSTIFHANFFCHFKQTVGCMKDRHLDALPVPIAIELGGDKLSIGKTVRYLGLEGLVSSRPVLLVKSRTLMP